jgi:hypothetical protein
MLEYVIFALTFISLLAFCLVQENVDRRLDKFFKRYRKMDIAYKLIHWSMATFILLTAFPAIIILMLTMGFNPLILYGLEEY